MVAFAMYDLDVAVVSFH